MPTDKLATNSMFTNCMKDIKEQDSYFNTISFLKVIASRGQKWPKLTPKLYYLLHIPQLY